MWLSMANACSARTSGLQFSLWGADGYFTRPKPCLPPSSPWWKSLRPAGGGECEPRESDATQRARAAEACRESGSKGGDQPAHDQRERETPPPAALKTTGGPPADRVAHQEPEIEGAGVHDQALEDVRMAAQVNLPQPAGVIDMGKRALDVFPSAPHQAPAPRAADSPTIAVHGALSLGRLAPTPSPAIGLDEVGAEAEGPQRQQRVVAVIPAVADEGRRRTGLPGRQLLGRRQRRRAHTRRVADVSPVQGHGHQRAGLEIDSVLDFVGQEGAPILQLRDFGIGVRWIHPLRIGRSLLAPTVEPGQRRAARRLEAGGL